MMESCRSEAAWQTRGREDWSGHSPGGLALSQSPKADCLHSQTEDAPTSHGRRIYIHEGSLARLARQGREAAQAIYETLARVSVLKILYHQVVQDGVVLGWISKDAAQRLAEELEPKGGEAATRCLHALGYRAEPRMEPQPLLERGEKVVASCYFDQYYTFATGEEMADQMYRDLRPMAEVRKLRESGESYQDLILINGSHSASLEFLGGKGEAMDGLSEADAKKARMHALGVVSRELTKTIEQVPLEGKERAFVVDTLRRALAAVFSRGALKTL